MLTIYGASDDLIEVEGDIREEFSHASDERAYLAFSNGVMLAICYDQDGVWRITPVTTDATVTIAQAPVDDESNYSDRATINADVTWVLYGTQRVVKR